MINNKLMISIVLALVIMSLAYVSSWMITAESQDLNTTNITIEDRIGMIMGNRISKMMDDTIDMIKNVNSTMIINQSENGITPVTNITDINKAGIKNINKLETLTGNNTVLDLDNISTDSLNHSMLLEEMEKSQIENATINEQGTTAFESQNISSNVNTIENTSSSDINQKTIDDNTGIHTILDADNNNNKTLTSTTTDKPTSRNSVENFFTQIGEAVKKLFGAN
jgi:hypothetical protein